jgi:hypothetical protein
MTEGEASHSIGVESSPSVSHSADTSPWRGRIRGWPQPGTLFAAAVYEPTVEH